MYAVMNNLSGCVSTLLDRKADYTLTDNVRIKYYNLYHSITTKFILFVN